MNTDQEWSWSIFVGQSSSSSTCSNLYKDKDRISQMEPMKKLSASISKFLRPETGPRMKWTTKWATYSMTALLSSTVSRPASCRRKIQKIKIQQSDKLMWPLLLPCSFLWLFLVCMFYFIVASTAHSGLALKKRPRRLAHTECLRLDLQGMWDILYKKAIL